MGHFLRMPHVFFAFAISLHLCNNIVIGAWATSLTARGAFSISISVIVVKLGSGASFYPPNGLHPPL
jgi:hypothetical protein